jgi:hypothetical protein
MNKANEIKNFSMSKPNDESGNTAMWSEENEEICSKKIKS